MAGFPAVPPPIADGPSAAPDWQPPPLWRSGRFGRIMRGALIAPATMGTV